jgi:[ribosomal protein S5]-alanine N-acetyltransferase
MTVLETDRLILRRLTVEDAPFMVRMLNDAAFLEYIGDKGVRTLEDARQHILTGPMDMYARYGHGLYLVQLRNGTPIGTCGLLKRDMLEHVDIGYAFMPDYRGQGYALEAATGVMDYARQTLQLGRVVAIVSRHNHASVALLMKIGLEYERVMTLPNGDQVNLFGTPPAPATA